MDGREEDVTMATNVSPGFHGVRYQVKDVGRSAAFSIGSFFAWRIFLPVSRS